MEGGGVGGGGGGQEYQNVGTINIPINDGQMENSATKKLAFGKIVY